MLWIAVMGNQGPSMNLDPVPDRIANEVSVLVESEIRSFADPETAAGIRGFLVGPRVEMRTWGWHQPIRKYPVWIIAESSKYDYGIAFSDYGFAPQNPWGLVFLSHSGFDADYCWYPTLESAYRDSRLIEEYQEAKNS